MTPTSLPFKLFNTGSQANIYLKVHIKNETNR